MRISAGRAPITAARGNALISLRVPAIPPTWRISAAGSPPPSPRFVDVVAVTQRASLRLRTVRPARLRVVHARAEREIRWLGDEGRRYRLGSPPDDLHPSPGPDVASVPSGPAGLRRWSPARSLIGAYAARRQWMVGLAVRRPLRATLFTGFLLCVGSGVDRGDGGQYRPGPERSGARAGRSPREDTRAERTRVPASAPSQGIRSPCHRDDRRASDRDEGSSLRSRYERPAPHGAPRPPP